MPEGSVPDAPKDISESETPVCNSVNSNQAEDCDIDKENQLMTISSELSKTDESTQVETKDKSILTECSQCNKKRARLSDDDSDSSPIKRQCVESPATDTEPMDCSNISSLVNSFDSGFTGLLAGACTSSDMDDCGLSKSVSLTVVNFSQGLSEGFSSCSTQIKESFDALAPAPIFLAV
jgi:hypothetical protein